MATRKLPTQKRQYHSIIGIDSGLDYSAPTTMIAETYTPDCEEVTFRDKVVEKAYGTDYFASTDTTPLTSAVVMAKQYVQNVGSEKFLVHTTTNIYVYNTESKLLECITEGVVVDDCESVWSVNGAVTCATSTSARKGTYSIAVTIPTTFTVGVAAYKNFTSKDLRIYDHLHFYIKSNVSTNVGQLRLRLSEQNAGGTGASYYDYKVPALTAGVWKEVSVSLSDVESPSHSLSGSPSTSPSASVSSSRSASISPSSSPSTSESASPSESPSASLSNSPSESVSASPSSSPSASVSSSPSVSVSPSSTPSASPSASVSSSPSGVEGEIDKVLSLSLVVATDIGAQVVNIDDVMATIELTGDEDNVGVAAVVNDYYVFSSGADDPLIYWDMATDTFVELAGGLSLSCKAMVMFGERLNLYGLPDLPRRVAWTVVGGLSIPPVTTDWTDSGSGDTDLDSIFGDDEIMTAHKLGNYVVVYGKKNIAMQEYTGKSVTDPYAFYVRVPEIGTPSSRGVANLGNSHIVLGWDDVYLYKGGTDVESIGEKINNELFSLINPTYINRSFVVYLEEQYEVRIYFPLIGSSTPNCYFTYSLRNGSWSRGSRSYTAFGPYKMIEGAVTWDTIGTATTTWDEIAIRWDDTTNETLSPLNIYGDSNGIVYQDNESTLNLVGVAIDGWWETKDFVVGDGYRRKTTNWMSLVFEGTGDTVMVSYSTDLGETFSTPVTFTLTDLWKMYRYDINVNSPQIRFRFRNYQLSETFSIRQVEVGYIEATDHGVA